MLMLVVKLSQLLKRVVMRKKNMRKLGTHLILLLIGFVVILGFVAEDEKSEEVPEDKDITLEDLGVKESQKADLKALWQLKRQNQLESLKDLKTLNRMAKDSAMSESEIRGTLQTLRHARLNRAQRIRSAEEFLVETLPIRAQLHLTILGVFENGLPGRIGGRRTAKTQRDSENNNGGRGKSGKH